MKGRIVTLSLGVFLLAACGKQDVHSACYSNGGHENMSDGRIIRICDCITHAVEEGKPTAQETKWIVAWFNKKTMETATPQEKEQAKQIAASVAQLKAMCERVK